MIETVILQHLQAAGIESVENKVYCEMPQSRPDNYLIIEKTGSTLRNHIQSALIAVQSVSSESLAKAARINEAVKAAMLDIPKTSAEVFSVKLNSDYNFTNTATKEYRYQAVFEIYY